MPPDALSFDVVSLARDSFFFSVFFFELNCVEGLVDEEFSSDFSFGMASPFQTLSVRHGIPPPDAMERLCPHLPVQTATCTVLVEVKFPGR